MGIIWPDFDRNRKMYLELKKSDSEKIRELDADISYLHKKCILLIDLWIITRERLQDCRRRRERFPRFQKRTK